MDTQITRVAELLHEAAETHHCVYHIVDGADDDWASWYGDWLLRLSELPQLLGRLPVRSELVYLLVLLDKEDVGRKPAEAWETYYARAIVQHFLRNRAAGRLNGSGRLTFWLALVAFLACAARPRVLELVGTEHYGMAPGQVSERATTLDYVVVASIAGAKLRHRVLSVPCRRKRVLS